MAEEAQQQMGEDEGYQPPVNFLDCYLGEVRMFAGTYAPRGWHFCDGSLLPISGNDTLFSLIGTTFGGDGRTTFGLPDYRSRVPVCSGLNEESGTRYHAGQMGGQEYVALTDKNLPPHTHAGAKHSVSLSLKASIGAATSAAPIPDGSLAASAVLNTGQGTANSYSEYPGNLVALDLKTIGTKTMGTSSSAGFGDTQMNTMCTLPLNFIIALAGTYPNRP